MGCERCPIHCLDRFPRGFWSKAYIITSEVADKVVEVAKAIPVKRSVKAIPNNSPCFLVIVTKFLFDRFIYTLKNTKQILGFYHGKKIQT